MQLETPALLEQSWNFGEAINAASFNDIRRGIVEIDGKPVAVFQTAERSFPPGVKLKRLTRGPVTACLELLPTIAQAVRQEYPRWSRNLLFWMPDVTDVTGAIRAIGKRSMTIGYTTARLNLSPEEDDLRRKLRGNWRNALSRAEDENTVIRVSWRMQDVVPFIAQYVRDRRAHKFSGPLANFVRILAENFRRDVVLIRTLDHGDVIAASLFLRHGTSATYYLF